MTSSDCARAGAASALKPISRKSALNKSSRGRTARGGIDLRSLRLGLERPSLRDFGSVLVAVRAQLDQLGAIELARRYRHARRHRMLLGLVLGVGGRAHGLERVLVFALGMEHPGGRDLRLDIDL